VNSKLHRNGGKLHRNAEFWAEFSTVEGILNPLFPHRMLSKVHRSPGIRIGKEATEHSTPYPPPASIPGNTSGNPNGW
jgi:hypothetical protein